MPGKSILIGPDVSILVAIGKDHGRCDMSSLSVKSVPLRLQAKLVYVTAAGAQHDDDLTCGGFIG